MNKAIITLDLINEICNPNGKLGQYADRILKSDIINKVNILTDWARRNQHLVIHVKVGFEKNYKDCSEISPIFGKAKEYQALQLNDWGCQFCEELQRDEGDLFITKHRVSAFYGTDLDLILRSNNIQNIILCGVATNNAVELTAREAHDRNYRVTVIGDAVQTLNDTEQEASLNFIKKIANISSVYDYIE